jgi:hypothetical protein
MQPINTRMGRGGKPLARSLFLLCGLHLILCMLVGGHLMGAPTELNFQGVLLDSSGNGVTGTRAMTVKLYDAAIGGNLLYTEDLGNVSVNKGVYSFNFGTNGISNGQLSETVAYTDGSATTFQKILTNANPVSGSVVVTDGIYNWNQNTGSSDDGVNFDVTYSTSLKRVTINYYNGTPQEGRTIVVSYRVPQATVQSALAGESNPWVELAISGVIQSVRQKLLLVPYASRALDSEKTLASSIDLVKSQLGELASAVAQGQGSSYSTITNRVNSTSSSLGLVSYSGSAYRYGGGELFGVDYGTSGKFISATTLTFSQQASNHNGYIKFTYTDGTVSQKTWTGFSGNGTVTYANPSPQKPVRYVNATQIAQGWNDGAFAQIESCSVFSSDRASLTFTVTALAKKIYVGPQALLTNLTSAYVVVATSDGVKTYGGWNQWFDLGSQKTVQTITVGGTLIRPEAVNVSQIKTLNLQ